MSESANQHTRDNLYRHSDLPPEAMQHGKGKKSLRNAAVLIPLIKQRDAWHVMFIRRTENKHDRHSGQVAFPGGMQDQLDNSLIDTALRETREEIGISSDNIKIISSLKPYLTVSYFRVTPVIGLVNWPCTMKLQPSEVARAFTIPLEWLRDETNFELRERKKTNETVPPGIAAEDARSVARERRYPVVFYKEYDGETLWGASARMTLNFIKALRDEDLLLPG